MLETIMLIASSVVFGFTAGILLYDWWIKNERKKLKQDSKKYFNGTFTPPEDKPAPETNEFLRVETPLPKESAQETTLSMEIPVDKAE